MGQMGESSVDSSVIVGQLEVYVAAMLFNATSQDELDAAVDDLLDDRLYRELCLILKALNLRRYLLANSTPAPAPAWLVYGASAERLTQIARVDRLMRLEAKALLPLHDKMFDFECFEPMRFLVDPAVPQPVKSALLARERAVVYLFAVAASTFLPADPKLVGWMLARWIADQQTYLGWVSALSNVEIPESDLPKEHRLDLLKIVAEHEAGEAYFNDLQKRAAASPDGTLCLGDVDDD